MDGREVNVLGVSQLIGSDMNKVGKSAEQLAEGITGETLPELELPMTDQELLSLKSKWENQYLNYESSLKKKQEVSKRYWLGLQNNTVTGDNRPIYDNLIFQSLETFLPQATSQNPVSVSNAGKDPEQIAFAKNVDGMNSYHAERLGLRYLLKDMARHWSLYYIGVLKVGWDEETSKNITLKHIHSQRILIDPDSTVDFKGRTNARWVGERKTVTAQELADLFPKFASQIKEEVLDQMGTNVTYTEWWTPDYCFYTFKRIVLQKMKNPHWNWNDAKLEVDEIGMEVPAQELPNHFDTPCIPYIFLTVFNIGEHPHDDTSLLEQNMRAQDLIQTRNDQITSNVNAMNNSLAFAGPFFTKEQAKQGNKAVNTGQGIFVPNGPIDSAVKRLNPTPLPGQVFDQLIDARQELMNVWGVRGLTAEGQEGTKTVRGRMMNQQYDSSRIGGTITESIEQVADQVFNWFVQLYCVYYDSPRQYAVIGQDKAVQQVSLSQIDFLQRDIVVTVVPNSMMPKDQVTKANQAMDLWEAGALDPVSLFTALDFPDPVTQAEKLYLWKTNPQALFPNIPPPQMQPGIPGESPPQDQNLNPVARPQSPIQMEQNAPRLSAI